MATVTSTLAYVGRGLVVAYRSARNIATDLRHGRFTAKVPGRDGETCNSDHRVLRAIFTDRVRPADVLVDVGCGRGRVLAHWLRYHPHHRLVGIEIDPDLAAATARRLRDEPRCRVVTGDAVATLPDDATLLFLFNPFGEDDIERLRLALEDRLPTQPQLRLLYSNPQHLTGFEASAAWRVRRVGLGGGRLVPFHDLAVIDSMGKPPRRM